MTRHRGIESQGLIVVVPLAGRFGHNATPQWLLVQLGNRGVSTGLVGLVQSTIDPWMACEWGYPASA